MEVLKSPIDAATVLPQKGNMALLRRVLSHGSKKTVCDVQIFDDSMFLSSGMVPAWIGLEYMAQTVAAHDGMIARGRGEGVKPGFFIGSRSVSFGAPGFFSGDTLVVSAEHVWGEGELFTFDCSVTRFGMSQKIVSGLLNFFRPKDFAGFLGEGGGQ